MREVSADELLAAYDAQLRAEAEVRSATDVTRVGPLWLATWAPSRGFVTHRSLGDSDEDVLRRLAEAVLAHFSADPRIEEVEWKTRAHDRTMGLGDVLGAAGFEPGPAEAIMIGEATHLAVDMPLPAGVALRRITSATDVHAMAVMEAHVFEDPSYIARVPQMLEDLARGDGVEFWAAEVCDDEGGSAQMVCAGRLEPVAGTDFAGLWGGGTLPQWRGRGIYRALTAARARSAVALGKRYLNADCTEMSRPILERSGLVAVSETTPWTWRRT